MLNLSIDSTNLEQSFDQIAYQLFNEYIISTGKVNYQLTEIEFYYNNQVNANDNFAHDHRKANYGNGTWRLHGAGLDIVLRNKNHYGGILIRGIEALDDQLTPVFGGVVDGPWNTVTACIRQLGRVTRTQRFNLKKLKFSRDRKFITSPRVGLFLKNEKDLEYICKPWRYISIPIVTKKERHLIFLQHYVDTEKIKIKQSPIIKQLGQSQLSRTTYLRYFEEGKRMRKEDFVKVKRTVENTCQMFGNYISRNYSKL